MRRLALGSCQPWHQNMSSLAPSSRDPFSGPFGARMFLSHPAAVWSLTVTPACGISTLAATILACVPSQLDSKKKHPRSWDPLAVRCGESVRACEHAAARGKKDGDGLAPQVGGSQIVLVKSETVLWTPRPAACPLHSSSRHPRLQDPVSLTECPTPPATSTRCRLSPFESRSRWP